MRQGNLSYTGTCYRTQASLGDFATVKTEKEANVNAWVRATRDLARNEKEALTTVFGQVNMPHDSNENLQVVLDCSGQRRLCDQR